ncbi:MAG: Nif3-like dinuclear metal center hexameric protein [Coriobacteriia bacterium]|nr:Nif3-like dinuclear metal center hexameric protein [Coriobacteriia bacterium]
MPSDAITVGALVAALERRFPAATAEPWDRVGLIVGDADSPVRGVLVTLDATAEAVARARDAGANVLATHHPPFLDMPGSVRAGSGPAGTLEAALRLGVAVIALHTNLDRSPEGAQALSILLGLDVVEPLEAGTEDVSFVVTYAPAAAVDTLREAMASAGAGRLGPYAGCAYLCDGAGYFTPDAAASPTVPASSDGVPEVRIEMVAPRASAAAVLEAARVAHPYEEPVIVAVDGVRARGTARLGRVCTWRDDATVSDLAAHVARTLGVSVRVWGDRNRPASRIAVANGSAGSLIDRAASVADVLVAGEVRYHDALGATAAGLAVIEAGHDMTEWPLVDVLARAVSEAAPGVNVSRESTRPGWWTMEDGR